jgi:hypothetical protein
MVPIFNSGTKKRKTGISKLNAISLQSNSVAVIHRLRKTVSLLIQSLKSQRRTVVPKRKP